MMNKKVIKVVSTLMMVIMMLSVVTTVFAGGFVSYNPSPATATSASTSIQTILNNVLGIAQIIGIGVAVIMLVVLAIKYISAAPGDKAEIKKHAVIYIVGAIVLFAASGILGIIKQFAGMIH